jgi:hypothetical protein
LQSEYRADIVIDTYRAIPFHKDPWGKVKKMSSADQDRFIHDWARSRVPNPESIYVLMVDGPALRKVQVLAGRGLAAQKIFTPSDSLAVRTQLQEALNAGRPDAGMLEALESMHERLQAHRGNADTASSFDWETLACVAVFFFGVWVVVTVYQACHGRSTSPQYTGALTDSSWTEI